MKSMKWLIINVHNIFVMFFNHVMSWEQVLVFKSFVLQIVPVGTVFVHWLVSVPRCFFGGVSGTNVWRGFLTVLWRWAFVTTLNATGHTILGFGEVVWVLSWSLLSPIRSRWRDCPLRRISLSFYLSQFLFLDQSWTVHISSYYEISLGSLWLDIDVLYLVKFTRGPI
jgi:hypothetical protein